jgi:hypothetical protein
MRFLPKFRITPFEPRGSSRGRAPEDLWKNNPVKRPDCQSGKGQKISSGSDSDTDGKYRYNRLFSKIRHFNRKKIGQFSGPAAGTLNRMGFGSI